MTDSCDDLIPTILRAAEGALPDGEQARLDRHLATCAACAQALADQREMHHALRAVAADLQVTHVGARVMATLRDEVRSADPASTWFDAFDWRRWTWRLAPVAAALAIVVASVSGTDAQVVSPDVVAEDTDGRPVSSALLTGDVSGDDLLTLLLNASADQTLTTAAGGGTQ